MKAKAKSYKDLEVWQKSHKFVLDVYGISKNFPQEEMFGLTSQIRRAAVSIPANIAEGFARSGTKDKLRFYNISAASLNEVDYYLTLIKDLKYSTSFELPKQAEEISRMLNGYIKVIKERCGEEKK